MRFTPRIGNKAWFGPRRFGWGWDPASWEGWVASAVWIAVLFATTLLPPRWQLGGAFAVSGGLLVTCMLTGTAPGGPKAAKHFREFRRGAARTVEEREADRRRRRLTEDEPSVAEAAARMRRLPPKP